MKELIKCYCGHTTTCDCGPETLEEAAVINYKKLYEGEPLTQDVPIDAFKQGAKWQQERSYSEEDMMFAYEQGARLAMISQSDLAINKGEFPNPKQWFEQFKKKIR